MSVWLLCFWCCCFASSIVDPAHDLFITLGECFRAETDQKGSDIFDSVQGFVGKSPVERVCLSPGRHVLNAERVVFVRQPQKTVAASEKALFELERNAWSPPFQNGLEFYVSEIPFDALKLGNPSMTIQALFNPGVLNSAVGSGGITAGFSQQGSLLSLHWPAPTAFDHLEVFRNKSGATPFMGSYFGVSLDEISWFVNDDAWSSSQRYLSENDNVVVTSLVSSQSNATIIDFVDPKLDVLVRRVSVSKGTVSFYENLAPCTFSFPEYEVSDWMLDFQNDFAVFYDANNSAMIHFSPSDPSDEDWKAVSRPGWSTNTSFGSGVYFAIGPIDAAVVHTVQCDTVSAKIVLGPTANVCEAAGRAFSVMQFNSSDVTVVFAAGPTMNEAVRKLKLARATGYNSMLQSNRVAWSNLLNNARLPVNVSALTLNIAKRAVITVFTAMDATSHSVAASIDNQLPYALDWPRDSAFINRALETMGFVEEARLHALFLASVQRKDGMFAGTFAQNFDNTGRVGGPVPLEIDQVGLAVWTMSRLLSAADGCEPIERSLQFLIKWRDPINHLPLPANEDDEFAFTQGTQGATAVLAGLNYGTDFVAKNCNSSSLDKYKARRDELAVAIRLIFYNSSCDCWGWPSNISSIRGMTWMLWPSNLFAGNESAILSQAENLYLQLLPFVNNVSDVYSYIAETAVVLAKTWRPRGLHADRLQNLIAALSNAASPNWHFGELYERGNDGTWSQLNDVPHTWEAVLFYQLTMESQ